MAVPSPLYVRLLFAIVNSRPLRVCCQGFRGHIRSDRTTVLGIDVGSISTMFLSTFGSESSLANSNW